MKLWHDIDSLDERDSSTIEAWIRVLKPFAKHYFRPVVEGFEHIPEGAALFVANHNSAMLSPDTFVWCMALAERLGTDAIPYGLAHEFALQTPGFHHLLMPLGAVRAAHDTAHRLFARGKKVLVYPGGDLEAFRPYRLRDRVVFGPRRGYVQLAVREGVPLVPVVTSGAHGTLFILHDGQGFARRFPLAQWMRLKVWPLALSVPWGLTFGPVPPHFPLPAAMDIRFLPALRFPHSGPEAAADKGYIEACHQEVLSAMQDTLSALAAARRKAFPFSL